MTHRHEERLDGKPSRAVLKAGRRKRFLLPSHHMLGYAHLGALMPARAVEHEHDLFGWTRADLTRERREFHREQLDVDRRRQMPHRAPRGWMHEADEVAPGIAMLDRSDGTLAGERPHPTQDWLEPDPVFVDGPQLDGRLWEGGRHLPQQGAEVGLELGLGLGVGADMSRSRLRPARAEPAQVTPAHVTAHPGS